MLYIRINGKEISPLQLENRSKGTKVELGKAHPENIEKVSSPGLAFLLGRSER